MLQCSAVPLCLWLGGAGDDFGKLFSTWVPAVCQLSVETMQTPSGALVCSQELFGQGHLYDLRLQQQAPRTEPKELYPWINGDVPLKLRAIAISLKS